MIISPNSAQRQQKYLVTSWSVFQLYWLWSWLCVFTWGGRNFQWENVRLNLLYFRLLLSHVSSLCLTSPK
jgi:hypothetical protein